MRVVEASRLWIVLIKVDEHTGEEKKLIIPVGAKCSLDCGTKVSWWRKRGRIVVQRPASPVRDWISNEDDGYDWALEGSVPGPRDSCSVEEFCRDYGATFVDLVTAALVAVD